MTTNVTLHTHDWPVRIVTTDEHTSGNVHSKTVTTEDVPPYSVRHHIAIFDTRKVEFIELPIPEPSQES